MKGILLSAILLSTMACDQSQPAKVEVKAYCRPDGGCDLTKTRCEFEGHVCTPSYAAWQTRFVMGDLEMTIISNKPETCQTAEESVKSLGYRFLDCEPL